MIARFDSQKAFLCCFMLSLICVFSLLFVLLVFFLFICFVCLFLNFFWLYLLVDIRSIGTNNVHVIIRCNNMSLSLTFYFLCYNSVNGGWSGWSGWTSCTKPCGIGSQERARSCTNPRPQHGGKSCSESAKLERSCNQQPCPGKKRRLLILDLYVTLHD